MIHDLQVEKERLDRIIATLEEVEQRGPESSKAGQRRGRKSMPESERERVSARMKEYWARRREKTE